MSRDIVLFDCLADDDFRGAVAVDIGCIPGVETTVVGGFEEREGLWWGNFLALFRLRDGPGQMMSKTQTSKQGAIDWLQEENGKGEERTSSSPATQGAHAGSPMLIAPRIGAETRNPLFPKLTYSTLLLSTLSLRESGSGGACMIAIVYYWWLILLRIGVL